MQPKQCRNAFKHDDKVWPCAVSMRMQFFFIYFLSSPLRFSHFSASQLLFNEHENLLKLQCTMSIHSRLSSDSDQIVLQTLISCSTQSTCNNLTQFLLLLHSCCHTPFPLVQIKYSDKIDFNTLFRCDVVVHAKIIHLLLAQPDYEYLRKKCSV